MEEQVQMNEKLRALLEKAKREKKIASKGPHPIRSRRSMRMKKQTD